MFGGGIIILSAIKCKVNKICSSFNGIFFLIVLTGDQVCSDSVRDDPNNINGKPCDKEQSGDSANRGTWKYDNEILENPTDSLKTLTVNGTIETCGYKIRGDLEDLDFVDPLPPFYEVRNGPQVLITAKCNRDFLGK